MDAVVSVRHLTKRIRGKTIVENISFDLYPGEIFGFLGPNGSGKTTTIRMLVDLIKPTSGEVVICGHHVRRSPEKALRHVGCIVENPEVYGYLTGWENLEQFARMLPGIGNVRIAEVAELVRLGERIHDKVRTYSLGMRQRLGIAQALLGKPRLLILDEPTNGLDPQGIHELRAFVRGLAETGISILISSHLLSEIQLICDRFAIIHGGRLKAVGDMKEVNSKAAGLVLWQLDHYERGREILASDPAVELTEREAWAMPNAPQAWSGPAGIATIMRFADIPSVAKRLAEHNAGIRSVQPAAPTLEDLFLETTT